MKTDNPKKYRLIIVLLIIVNLAIIISWWYFDSNGAWKHDDKRRGRRGFKKENFESTLGLDSLQKVRFDKMNKQHHSRLEVLKSEVDSLKQLIKTEVFKKETDEQRIDTLFTQIASRRTTIDTSIYFHFKNLKKACTQEQKVVFDSLMQVYFHRKDYRRSGRR